MSVVAMSIRFTISGMLLPAAVRMLIRLRLGTVKTRLMTMVLLNTLTNRMVRMVSVGLFVPWRTRPKMTWWCDRLWDVRAWMQLRWRVLTIELCIRRAISVTFLTVRVTIGKATSEIYLRMLLLGMTQLAGPN